MDLKKARVLVESREKLDPDYKKAVKMCIEDDRAEISSVKKVAGKPQTKTEVK